MTEPKKKCGDCQFYNPKTTRNGCGVCTTGQFKGLYVDPIMKACPWSIGGSPEQKPKTNRDIINEMTDEELARWKLDLSGSEHVRGKNGFCRIGWQDTKPCYENLKCKDCLTAWLKAPAGKHQEVK